MILDVEKFKDKHTHTHLKIIMGSNNVENIRYIYKNKLCFYIPAVAMNNLKIK